MEKNPVIDPNNLHAAMMRAFEETAKSFGMSSEELKAKLEDLDIEA